MSVCSWGFNSPHSHQQVKGWNRKVPALLLCPGPRTALLDWWLYLKTELPDDPVRIARQSDWGQGQLAKVSTLTQTENQADHETGRPALYDNAIDTDYTHSIGIQKGQI